MPKSKNIVQSQASEEGLEGVDDRRLVRRRHVWEHYTIGNHPKGSKGKRCKICGWSGKLHTLAKYGVPECSANVESIHPETKPTDAEQESGKGLDETPCSVVMAQCEKCRDMAEFRREELPTACGWAGCSGIVTEKLNPPNA